MFNNERITELEKQIAALYFKVKGLSIQIENNTTMRVGVFDVGCFAGYPRTDSRPVISAIDLCKLLLDQKKLAVQATPSTPQTIVLVKA